MFGKKKSIAILIQIGLFGFILFSSSVIGQIDKDDFSDLNDWEIWGESWEDAWFDGEPINGTFKSFESDYQLVNESLYVAGDEYQEYYFNIACRENKVGVYGNWSIEAYTPRVFKEFKLGLVNDRSGQIGRTFKELNYTGLELNVRSHGVETFLYEYDEELNHSLRTIGGGNPNIHAIIDSTDRFGWHVHRLERNSTHLSFYIDEELKLVHELEASRLNEIESFCIYAETGSGVYFDNVFISGMGEDHPSHDLLIDQESQSKDNLLFIYIMGIAAGGIGTVAITRYFWTRSSPQFEKASDLVNTKLQEGYSWDVNNYYALLGLLSKGRLNEIDNKLAESLENYKFLLHPTRLLVMKTIYENHRITSSYLREFLDLTWGQITFNLKKLEEAGYVSLKDEFHETSLKQTVYLEEFGRLEFEKFIETLDNVLNSNKFNELYPEN